MPSGSHHYRIESSMTCGIKKTFNHQRQATMWLKLHKKGCERCRNADTITHSTEIPTNYDSVSNFLLWQQTAEELHSFNIPDFQMFET